MASFLEKAKFAKTVALNKDLRNLARNPEKMLTENPEKAMQAFGKGIELMAKHPNAAAQFMPEGPLRNIARQAAKKKEFREKI